MVFLKKAVLKYLAKLAGKLNGISVITCGLCVLLQKSKIKTFRKNTNLFRKKKSVQKQ